VCGGNDTLTTITKMYIVSLFICSIPKGQIILSVTVIAGQISGHWKKCMFFFLDNDHHDALLPVQEKHTLAEKLCISYETSMKTFNLYRKTYCYPTKLSFTLKM
jgi:predicted transglutaminase-like protease